MVTKTEKKIGFKIAISQDNDNNKIIIIIMEINLSLKR